MSLKVAKPTSAALRFAQGYTRPDDPDAVAYIAAVEAADGQALETATRMAINAFVKGCKADGTWPALKASCILAGARTLAGALVPLVGAAPTNNGFVTGDYNRKTGLVGDGSTKYLNTNAPINTTCRFNNAHISVYASTAATSGVGYIGNDDISSSTGELGIYRNSTNFGGRIQSPFAFSTSRLSSSVGFIGAARSAQASMAFRSNSATDSISYASSGASSSSANVAVFSRDIANASSRSNPRLAFYSIGESLDLALLDTRVTALVNAFAAAIP